MDLAGGDASRRSAPGRGGRSQVSNTGPQTVTGQPRQLTHESDSELPAWSPDGRSIAFLRPDSHGRKQIRTMNAAGGEARQVTDEPAGVDALAWSPDGKRIAYRADTGPDLAPRAADLAKPESPAGQGNGKGAAPGPRSSVARRIRYREDGAGWRGDRFRHIFTADLTGNSCRQVSFGDGDDGAPVWSPDGAHIAFISDCNPFRDTTARNDIHVIPGDGGEPDRRSGGLFMAGSITWSPDGARLAATAAQSPEEVGGHGLICQSWVHVLEPGAYPQRLTDDSVRPATTATGHPVGADFPTLRWTADGRLLFIADARGQSYVCEVPASGGDMRRVTGGGVRRITGGGCQITAWAVDSAGKTAVIAAATPSSPSDLYLVDLATGEQRRLTSFNDDYLAAHPPAKLEKFAIRQGGSDVECRLWLPPDFDPSRRYPLLLDVHGGPHSVFYDAFYPIHQIGATNGYVVLAPNPRGSSTYGLDFATAVHGDWGGGDYMDIMTAVSEAAKLPYVDQHRVVIHGSSYGGYMASWAVGHTDRFRAAVIAAPVTYLPSFYGTSDIGVNFGEVQFGGSPSDELARYIRHSPLTYARHVSTPVLLLHGEDDFRVPIEQSEQYFVALKRAGKAVEFVRLPRTSHGIFRAKDPAVRREYFSRMLAWFGQWLNQPPGAGSGSRSELRPAR